MKTLAGLLTCLLFFSTVSAGEGFPLREKYKGVPYIEIGDLHKEYDDVIIVDVRSKFEFDIVKINNSINILVSKATFLKEIEKLRPRDGSKKMVFYCNGHTCKKSYQATEKATKAGFKNVYAYDAGVFDWIKAYGDKGSLLGESPVDASKILSKDALAVKSLDWTKFKAAAAEAGVMIIDVRDPIQREKKLGLKGTKNIPLDRVKNLVKAKKFQDKKLLIFDAVGKQVKWLHYYMEENGYKNYYFLTKGVGGAS